MMRADKEVMNNHNQECFDRLKIQIHVLGGDK